MLQDLVDQLNQIRTDLDLRIAEVKTLEEVNDLRTEYAGRKGKIAGFFKQMGSVPPEERGKLGQKLNELKIFAQERIDSAAADLTRKKEQTAVDVTLPGRKPRIGTLHPLTLVERKVRSIFNKMGFTVAHGPEIEDIWYNFDALNTPEWHPSRDPSDTLYLDNGKLLRTETSPIQIRVMQQQKPPVRIVGPGRVFRNDKPDATHSPMFTQVEGLYVDEGVTFSDLKGTVLEFYRHMFGRDVQTRFRPHFFPFTEPSAEVDISCIFCSGKGCRICKGSGWIEMGGSGMVHPNVLETVGIDTEKYTGWAFGLGIERLALLMYGIPDIRMLYENDYRFLAQLGGRR